RVMAKALTLEDVRQMHLDDRQVGREECIEHRYRGVGQRTGVEDDAVGGFARLLYPVDELTFVVGLPKLDLQVEGRRSGEAPLLDIGQGVVAVNRRITHSEQIEVGTVQDIDGRHSNPPKAIP